MHSVGGSRAHPPLTGVTGAREQYLVGRIGPQRVAVPVVAVERILPMAAVTPLPDAPPSVSGVLNYRGTVLPVVDPHPRLGLPSPPARPDQFLLVISTGGRYLLRVDAVELIVEATGDAIELVQPASALAPRVLRLAGHTLPILDPAGLNPGSLARGSEE